MKLFNALVGAFSLSFTVTAAIAEPIVWDMPNEYPATSIQGETDAFFSARLEELSGGEMSIVHHYGGAIGFRSRDQLDAVGDGAVPLANTFIAPLGGIDPLFLLMSLPFLTSDSAEARALFEIAEPHFNTLLESHNQRLLYSSPWAPSGLWSRKEITGLEALKLLKMRSYDANSTKVFRAAGAAPVQLSWADIVPQLSAGGIDGVLTSIEAGLSASFNEYTPVFAALNYDSTINIATINLDVWNGLSEEQKAILEQAANETEDHAWANVDVAVSLAYEEARAAGMTVIAEPDPAYRAALVDRAAPVIAEWLEKSGETGQSILSSFSTAMGREISN
ncbi:TRAP transporter substrate-binding protein [Leisingera sp.]|uniref:TRAP transporter substrate-binding protein n=1 Tax=Leisingera sp. TaxID=1879318 RepID=UPI002B26D921|nr:TRAP transporter substrate-binding protein [Leisingera sp.]